MTGPAAVERYLAEVAARLPGSARVRSGIVAELRAGLLDATDAHRSAGLPPAEAAAAAIREFGDPGLVAGGFRAEIAAGLARRVSIAVLVTGPLVGLLWIVTAAASHLTSRLQWASLPAGLRAGLALTAIAAGVTACGALYGIAMTGRRYPLGARPATPGADGRRGRRVRRHRRRRGRPGAACRRAGHHPGTAFPGPGRRGGGGQPRPDTARPARGAPVPNRPRGPDLTFRDIVGTGCHDARMHFLERVGHHGCHDVAKPQPDAWPDVWPHEDRPMTVKDMANMPDDVPFPVSFTPAQLLSTEPLR